MMYYFRLSSVEIVVGEVHVLEVLVVEVLVVLCCSIFES
jgi:hypothetical protein